jgi:hypothetical protein
MHTKNMARMIQQNMADFMRAAESLTRLGEACIDADTAVFYVNDRRDAVRKALQLENEKPRKRKLCGQIDIMWFAIRECRGACAKCFACYSAALSHPRFFLIQFIHEPFII